LLVCRRITVVILTSCSGLLIFDIPEITVRLASNKGGRFGENKVDSIHLKISFRLSVAIIAGFLCIHYLNFTIGIAIQNLVNYDYAGCVLIGIVMRNPVNCE